MMFSKRSIFFLLLTFAVVIVYAVSTEMNVLQNEYSLELRTFKNTGENAEFVPVYNEILVVLSIDGREISRNAIATGGGCSLFSQEELIFEDFVDEIRCDFLGSSELFVLHNRDSVTAVVDRYELTDAAAEDPSPSDYSFIETIFEGNIDLE